MAAKGTISKERHGHNMFDIIVIGSGCAGMTAALYALRAGRTVLLLENNGIGGQIASSPKVENFPSVKQISGSEFSDNLFEQVNALGVEFSFEEARAIEDKGSIKVVKTDDGEHECKAVIIATGLKHRTLPVPRAEEMLGRGVSYCAVCDGIFHKGKDVAVVGGGNTALQDAVYLSQYCGKVYLIHRRDTFRADNSNIKMLQGKTNIELVLDSVATELVGDDFVSGIKVKNVKTEEERELSVSGVFSAVGKIPQSEIFKGTIELDESGYIIADETCRTSKAGIFAAGDCRTKEIRQLTTAASDGAVAAIEASKYINTLE